jgi:hypothetical protein
VGGGLLERMDSEDELAAVIGHEIEHIDHYHCAERVPREEALRKIPLGGLVALPIEVFEGVVLLRYPSCMGCEKAVHKADLVSDEETEAKT